MRSVEQNRLNEGYSDDDTHTHIVYNTNKTIVKEQS